MIVVGTSSDFRPFHEECLVEITLVDGVVVEVSMRHLC